MTTKGDMDYDSVAITALQSAFGLEWTRLDSRRRKVVLRDYQEAWSDEQLSATEYQRRIGTGNLKSYGDVMLTRERQGWRA